ncbi:MAG TPA: SRPBCC domain-containing protein [Tepidisphaeraceae bacterium]|nr:SRPBCC domain-containing protein [Tepidisphaeraceae bacterium]
MQASDPNVSTIDIQKEELIEAPIEIVFEAILDQLGPEGQMPDSKPFPMKLEAWPGGRLFRDLGNNTGHLWGHIQVIKPPTILEICGPLFMSYPGINHLQYRLASEGSATRLKFTHKAMGLIPKEHREGVTMGWEWGLKRIKQLAQNRKSATR